MEYRSEHCSHLNHQAANLCMIKSLDCYSNFNPNIITLIRGAGCLSFARAFRNVDITEISGFYKKNAHLKWISVYLVFQECYQYSIRGCRNNFLKHFNFSIRYCLNGYIFLVTSKQCFI